MLEGPSVFRPQKAKKMLTDNTTIFLAKELQTQYDVTITVNSSQVSSDKIAKYESWLLSKYNVNRAALTKLMG